MLNRQINYDLPAAGALSVGSGLSVVVSQPVLAEGAAPPQSLVLLTCPKQSLYLCSHTDAPAKLAALIISALSLQAFRAIWNINFAGLQVSKGFFLLPRYPTCN